MVKSPKFSGHNRKKTLPQRGNVKVKSKGQCLTTGKTKEDSIEDQLEFGFRFHHDAMENCERTLLETLAMEQSNYFLTILPEKPKLVVVHSLAAYPRVRSEDPLRGRVLGCVAGSSSDQPPRILMAPETDVASRLFVPKEMPVPDELAFLELHRKQKKKDLIFVSKAMRTHPTQIISRLMYLPKNWVSVFEGNELSPFEAYEALRLVVKNLKSEQARQHAEPLKVWLRGACFMKSQDPDDSRTSALSINWTELVAPNAEVVSWVANRLEKFSEVDKCKSTPKMSRKSDIGDSGKRANEEEADNKRERDSSPSSRRWNKTLDDADSIDSSMSSSPRGVRESGRQSEARREKTKEHPSKGSTEIYSLGWRTGDTEQSDIDEAHDDPIKKIFEGASRLGTRIHTSPTSVLDPQEDVVVSDETKTQRKKKRNSVADQTEGLERSGEATRDTSCLSLDEEEAKIFRPLQKALAKATIASLYAKVFPSHSLLTTGAWTMKERQDGNIKLHTACMRCDGGRMGTFYPKGLGGKKKAKRWWYTSPEMARSVVFFRFLEEMAHRGVISDFYELNDGTDLLASSSNVSSVSRNQQQPAKKRKTRTRTISESSSERPNIPLRYAVTELQPTKWEDTEQDGDIFAI